LTNQAISDTLDLMIQNTNDHYRVDKLYSYIVTHDSGFAPNPFLGICSLACCKPKIREMVGRLWPNSKDIWIVGVSRKSRGNKVIYIMRVDEVVNFTEYYQMYPKKRPDFTNGDYVRTRGDNIYKPSDSGFEQLRSKHSNNPKCDDWSPDCSTQERDLRGKNVLLSKNFIYFGEKAIEIPPELRSIIASRGYKCRFERSILDSFERLVNNRREELKAGSVLGKPDIWDGDWPILGEDRLSLSRS